MDIRIPNYTLDPPSYKNMVATVNFNHHIYIIINLMHNLFFNLLMIIPTLQKEYNN